MALASPIYGWSVKKYRPKNTALMGCCIGCFAFILASECKFYNTLPELLILYLGIGGLGCGAVIYTGNIEVATYFDERRYVLRNLFNVNERVNSYYNHETSQCHGKYVFLSLCLFLSSCLHAVRGKRIEPTKILFK